MPWATPARDRSPTTAVSRTARYATICRTATRRTGAWGCPPTTPRWPRGPWSRCCGRARPAAAASTWTTSPPRSPPGPCSAWEERCCDSCAPTDSRSRSGEPMTWWELGQPSAGNGALMRIAPHLLPPPARPEPGPVARRHRCHRPHPRRRDGRRLERRVRRAVLRVPGVAGPPGAPGRVVARDLPALRGSPGDRRGSTSRASPPTTSAEACATSSRRD